MAQMRKEAKNHWVSRKLNQGNKIPYDLLLLADETIEAINKYIFDSDLYIVEQEDKVIAIYALYSLNHNEIEIKNIAVDKAFQAQGIGRFLLQDATIRAKEMNYKTIIIGTADTAVKQLRLYQEAGFEQFEIKKDFFRTNYAVPIVEVGLQLKDMVMLRKTIK